MKIVIVAPAILPRISPRSFRATELAKAFSKKGHEVVLLSVLGKYDYSSFQISTGVQVKDIGTPIIATRNSDGKLKLPLWKLGLIFILRKLLEFPDILLMKKVKNGILKQGDIDLLITIAVPYPIHWGAAMIKKKDRNFTTWVSDCGDPYMGNDMGTRFFYFKYLEKWWARKTDYITIPIEDARKSYYSEFRDKIVVIPQGFDFTDIKLLSYKQNKIPTFLYAGALYKGKRDPDKFLQFLTTLKGDFKFIVYTDHIIHFESYKNILNNKLEIKPLVQRESLMIEMSKMDFLINISNKGTTAQVPSKLIDYAITERPILEISSDFTNEEKKSFESFLKKDYSNRLRIKNIEEYNINNIVNQFLSLHT